MTGEHSGKGRNDFGVLVLDEDPATAELVRETLKEIGETHPVYWCDALDEAFDTLASHRIAILVAQMRLDEEEISGALKTLKRHHPGTRLIVLSSAKEAPRLAELLSEGHAYRCLHNPVSRVQLGRTLAGAIAELTPRYPLHNRIRVVEFPRATTSAGEGRLRALVNRWRQRAAALEG